MHAPPTLMKRVAVPAMRVQVASRTGNCPAAELTPIGRPRPIPQPSLQRKAFYTIFGEALIGAPKSQFGRMLHRMNPMANVGRMRTSSCLLTGAKGRT